MNAEDPIKAVDITETENDKETTTERKEGKSKNNLDYSRLWNVLEVPCEDD